MKRKSGYRFYVWAMILSAGILAGTLAVTSLKIISGGRHFTQVILEENKAFVVNSLRFGHGMIAHMGNQNYKDMIDLALESEFIRFLAVLDKKGEVIVRGGDPEAASSLKRDRFTGLRDGEILEEKEGFLLVAYRAPEGVKPNEEHMRHHATFRGHMKRLPEPGWYLVGLDISVFRRHYRDMLYQTIGSGGALLLLGALIIVFFGIVQRYELAHLSIEKLDKIKRLLGHFVPDTAKQIIEKDPGKKGILDKYVRDATILFLDIEGFTHLLQAYPQERVNRAIEHYFSIFLDIIQKNGGDVNETAGDGMMVIFLQDDPHEHAKAAVQAALDIHKACLEGRGKKREGLFPIQVNVGIQSGDVFLGSTKLRAEEGERWTFTASGKPTVLAARFAEHARGGEILMGEETVRRVKGLFEWIPLGNISLKNIQDPLPIYRLSV